MPKIPVYESTIPVRSVAPTTGLSPASANTAIPQAIGDIGQSIGQAGNVIEQYADLIYKRELKHQEEDKKLYLEREENNNIEKPLLQFSEDIAGKTGSDVLTAWDNVLKFEKGIKDYTDLSNISKDDWLGNRIHNIGGFTPEERQYAELKRQMLIEKYKAKIAPKVAEARKVVQVQSSQETTNNAIIAMQLGDSTLQEAIETMKVSYENKGFGKEEKNIYIKDETQRITVSFLDKAIDDGDMKVVQDILDNKYNQLLLGSKGNVKLANEYRDKATKAKEEILVDNKINEMEIKYGTNFEKAMENVRNDKTLSNKQQKTVLATLRTAQNDYDESLKKQQRDGHENDINTIFGFINKKDNKSALKATQKAEFLDEKEKHTIYESLKNGDDPFKKTDGGTANSIYNNIMNNKYPEDYRFAAIPGVLNIKDAEHFTELNKQMHKEDITARKEAMRHIQKTIITGGGGKLEWQFNPDGSIGMNTNASPDLQQKSYKATKELNDTLDAGLKKGKSLRDMVTPGTADYVVDKVIMGNSPSYRDSVSAQVQKLKRGDLYNQVKGFKTTEQAVSYLENTYGYSRTQATELVREGHKAGYY